MGLCSDEHAEFEHYNENMNMQYAVNDHDEGKYCKGKYSSVMKMINIMNVIMKY